MSRLNVHGGMGRASADARDELLLTGSAVEPALSEFLDDMRLLSAAVPPAPVGELAAMLEHGFTPEVATAPARPVRDGAIRRWSARTAAAATALLTTFGGMAAAGALPDSMQQWASDTAARINVSVPAPHDVELRNMQLPAAGAHDGRDTGNALPRQEHPAPDALFPAAPDDAFDDDRRRGRDGKEQRRDEERDAAQDAADEEADRREDETDDAADAAEDAARAEQERREEEAEAAEEAAEDAVRAREEAAEEAREAKEAAERARQEAAEDAADEAEDAADDAADDAEDAEDDD